MFGFMGWLRSFRDWVHKNRHFLPKGLRWKRIARSRRKNQNYILTITPLEPRVVPTVDTWTGGGGTTAWATAANWSNGVPTTGEDVVISTGTGVS